MKESREFYFIARVKFDKYEPGDEIKEAEEIKKIIDTNSQNLVIKVFKHKKD